jgi:hypothetical protein
LPQVPGQPLIVPRHSVDGFVTALMEQQGWAEVTEPSAISVDGYVGKAFQRTDRAVMSDCTTVNTADATFESWETADGGSVGSAGMPAHLGHIDTPGQIESLWVLDIDGTVVVISTAPWPGQSGTAGPGFAYPVLDSIRIERP